MKLLTYFVSAAVILLGTLLGGWLQGRMITRWGADELLAAAGKRLDSPLPEQVGGWRFIQETKFEPEVVRMLQCPAHVSRVYVHQQTGDTVSIAVIVGPPGPVAVHTPEVCYSAQDYAITSDRAPLKVVDSSQREHQLWQVSLEPRTATAGPQRVLYAWGTGGPWLASGNPRINHAGEPYLYKIQLAGPTVQANAEFDPCQDFLRSFLPELQTLLVPTSQAARASVSTP